MPWLVAGRWLLSEVWSNDEKADGHRIPDAVEPDPGLIQRHLIGRLDEQPMAFEYACTQVATPLGRSPYSPLHRGLLGTPLGTEPRGVLPSP